MKDNTNVRTASGPAASHIDQHRDGRPRRGPTHLRYLKSAATNPPDRLLIGEEEYEIESGLVVAIPIGVPHSVLSSDPDSHRTFIAIDSVTAENVGGGTLMEANQGGPTPTRLYVVISNEPNVPRTIISTQVSTLTDAVPTRLLL